MKKTIQMIPIALGIIWIGIRELSLPDSKLSSLTIENIEALTNETELPEITITCSSGSDGQCFIQGDRLAMCGEYMYYPCKFLGIPDVSCSNPPCNNRRLF